ncbi:MAG: hypothetical protein E7052_02580 [Lentisphaerae bacterium]|nr:hypothetical protein [Lentisphaerota bacterium]
MMTVAHDFPFDPSNGYTLEMLLQIAPGNEVDGFAEFWQNNYQQVMEAPLRYKVEAEVWSSVDSDKTYRIKFENYDGQSITMWIARPENSCGGLLQGQGYSNPGAPCVSEFGLTTAYACVRGLGFSQCKNIPWMPHKHVLHGIDCKENYILRGVIADQWMAARVLLDMFPDTEENLCYTGGSMGGGMGALLLAWDKRFRAAYLNIPTFGSEVRFDHQSTGSGEACRMYVLEHPEALEVLRWFDASAAAKYISIPTACAPAQFDPCVAPVGQFSIANALSDKIKTLFIREVGHFAPTLHDKKLNEDILQWCRKNFTVE